MNNGDYDDSFYFTPTAGRLGKSSAVEHTQIELSPEQMKALQEAQAEEKEGRYFRDLFSSRI